MVYELCIVEQFFFYNSFLPASTRAWNELDESIKQATSLAPFKSLSRDIKHPPKEYNYGTRNVQILHSRYAWNAVP